MTNDPMDSSGIKILLLGSPLILLNGQPVKINRREIRAVLFYLAGHSESISRSQICDDFWPQESESIARKKLTEIISKIRASLNPVIIQTLNEFVSINPEAVYVDSHEYFSMILPLMNSSEINSSGKLPDWFYKKMREALRLCRGDHFLQGVNLKNALGFENWVLQTNQTYVFSHEKIVERLIDHCIAIGNIDEAILWLGEMVRLDPLNEDYDFLLLDCLKERGRIKDALDFVDYFEKIFALMQNEPLPQVFVDFKKRIEENRKKQNIYIQDEWPGAELNAVPFVGRSDLIKKLAQAYNRKGIVHVTGESGSGKTRLVQEFYSRMDTNPRLLFFIGKPMVSSSPFSPLIEGLRTQVKPEEWLALPEPILDELVFLFPERKKNATLSNSIIMDLSSKSSVQILFNALYVLLLKLAEKKPLLFVIDITQWCDDATIEFLSYLNEKQFFKKNGLLILISRQEEKNPNLEIYIDRSVLANNLEKIVLEPFNQEETAQLATQVLGRDISEELIHKIQSDTGGNPFFLIETLRAFSDVDFDLKNYSENDFYPIPDTIRSMVNEKVRILSQNAREVLQAASVLGQQFLPEVLEYMLEFSSEELITALEELQRASIIIGESGLKVQAHYEFPHDQIREVVLEELSPARKRKLHLLAVKALQKAKGDLPEKASILAWHYEQAGELTCAFETWCSAGRFARSRFSRDDTYAAYQHAFDLLPSLPADYPESSVHLLFAEWADYAYDLSDDITCEKIYAMCLEIGENKQSPLLIGTALSGLGRVAGMRSENDKGIELIDRALFFLGKSDFKGEELEALVRRGILTHLNGDIQTARMYYERSLQTGKDYSDKRVLDALVNAEVQLSLILILSGQPAQAEKIALEAVNDSQLVLRRSAKVRAMIMLAMAEHYLSEYAKSIQIVLSVYNMSVQLGMRFWGSMADLVLAKNYLAIGQIDQCWMCVSKALERENSHPQDRLDSHCYCVIGDIYRVFGDFKSAEEYYRKGAREPLANYHALENYYRLGNELCRQGQMMEGIQVLQDTIKMAEENSLAIITLPAKAMLLFQTISETAPQDFIDQISEIRKEMQTCGFYTFGLMVDLILAEMNLQQGNSEIAEQQLIQISDMSRDQKYYWYELQANFGLLKINSKNDQKRRLIEERSKIVLDEIGAHTNTRQFLVLFNRFRKEFERN